MLFVLFFSAFLYATGAAGPVLGFALGALMLQFYVDSFTFDSGLLNVTPSDPRWVGAWWGGFIICGFLLIVISIPFFAFPKVLHKEKAKLCLLKEEQVEALLDEDTRHRIENYGRNIKGIDAIVVCVQIFIICFVSIKVGFYGNGSEIQTWWGMIFRGGGGGYPELTKT